MNLDRLKIGDRYRWRHGKHPGEVIKITKVSTLTCEYEITGANKNKGGKRSKRCQIRVDFLMTNAEPA